MKTYITSMKECKFENVCEVLRRTVKKDGRAGSLQNYIGKDVDVITYLNTEEHEDN